MRQGSVTKGWILIALVFCATSCSESTTSVPAASKTAAPVSASAQHRVSGTAPLPPTGGKTIVTLEPRTPRTFPPQTSPPSMDQVQQTFTPGFLFVRTGQPVDFLNNDDVLHNVRVRDNGTREAAFNVAIPVGEKYVHSFTRDGLYEVGCDIHPGMSAVVVSTSTPYATVADGEGRFAFDDVAPGAYRVAVAVGGRRIEREIDVAGAPTEVTIREPG